MIPELNLGDDFDLSHGFLPVNDPIQHLPPALSAWDDAAYDLPKIICHTNCRSTLEKLPPFDCQHLNSHEDWLRAMLVLSFLAHGYVWCDPHHRVDTLPALIAQPWAQVAAALGRPPVLSYASYALYNWRRFDTNQPPVLGNIALLQNFFGGIDEEWFILIHIDIEHQAIDGLSCLLALQTAAQNQDVVLVQDYLSRIATSIDNMCLTLERMPEHCDPYIYFERVRPCIHGWHENPALPNGLIYQGVEAYQQKGQFFKGETGAQSAIIPCLDAVLGIFHEDNPLRVHLQAMRDYMPRAHHAFLEMLEKNTAAHDWIQNNRAALGDPYQACIDGIYRFRKIHYNYSASYINKQSQSDPSNPTDVGTGGTPFMAYLKKHLEESSSDHTASQ